LSAGKTDIWMPVYIGDYLADTMHLSTEQHGAYLLLLFHLWRRGVLQDDDVVLAKITGLRAKAWSTCRGVLAEFFEIHDGLWHHRRVERERIRVAAKHESNSNKAKIGATVRWNKAALAAECSLAFDDPEGASSNASSNAWAMPDDAKSQSQPEPQFIKAISRSSSGNDRRVIDARHGAFRLLLAEYWRAKNDASPEMPWQGRDAKALSDFLTASPHLTESQFRTMLANRAKSAVAHGDRVFLWIANLTRFQEEINVYNKPVSAGGGHASRAEINRNSVVSAVDRALDLAREHADRARQAGSEQAAFADPGMPFVDGGRSAGCALALPGDGDYGMATGHVADGQAGTDGPLPYGTPTAAASESSAAGSEPDGQEWLQFEREVTVR
jgi:uncharacterized protein YdaU (DUF1376 family)